MNSLIVYGCRFISKINIFIYMYIYNDNNNNDNNNNFLFQTTRSIYQNNTIKHYRLLTNNNRNLNYINLELECCHKTSNIAQTRYTNYAI